LKECHFPAINDGMITTIDSAGRVVVPKALRDALNLKPGQPLEIRVGDGGIEIDVAPTPLNLEKRGKGVVAVPPKSLPTLTAERVRETLERIRR
jgi:AbrB family looped-hinge helix DNA binding protein